MFRQRGWVVARSAGSRGAADLVCVRAGGYTPILCQVKTDKAGPFANFGPEARRELLAEAQQAGARALLLWWPPRGPKRFLYADEGGWPNGS